MTPRAEREPVVRADAARNRARVLQVAREQLAGGDDSLQLNTIARLAGVGVGTVYRHFPNRHALWEALLVERFQELVDQAQAAAADEDALAGLHRLLRFALGRALEDAGFAAVLESASDADARTSAMKAELDRAVAELLSRARRSDAIRGDIEADDVRRLLCGLSGRPDRPADRTRRPPGPRLPRQHRPQDGRQRPQTQPTAGTPRSRSVSRTGLWWLRMGFASTSGVRPLVTGDAQELGAAVHCGARMSAIQSM
ncbi:TetR/AcrR family transcriptional regulator [Nocardia sp. Marseille-Q1738]